MSGDQAVNPPHTVQLRHELPDGSWHIDWMLDLDPARAAKLTTFRLPGRVDELSPGDRMDAERIADHRRVYLAHEGPVDGDRGHVTRVAAGRIEAVQNVGDIWAFVIHWETTAAGEPRRVHRQTIHVHPHGEAAWVVVSGGAAGPDRDTIVLGS